MTYAIATAEPVFLMSLFKPIVFIAMVTGWGYVVSNLDSDAGRFFLKRRLWNMAHIGSAVLAFGLLLMIPYFFVGLPLALMILVGVSGGYVYYRNNEVPNAAKWEVSLQFIRDYKDQRGTQSAQKHASIVLMKKDETRLPVPSRDDPSAEAHSLFENVLDFSLPRGSDRIDILVEPSKAAIVARIDGVSYPQPPVEPALAMRLVEYLKTSAGLDLAERRKKQNGVIKVDGGELGRHTLELTTSGSTRGLSLSINIDPDLRTQMPLERLGMLDPQLKQAKALLESLGGVTLVAAPPAHGTTTTLYSILSEHDPYTSSVVTLEDDIAWELEGVHHNHMPTSIPPEKYNEKLMGVFRADPQVLYLTRFADSRSPGHIANGANECRVYMPLEADDTFGALRGWVKAVGDRKLAAKSITAVIAQRLLRRLCHTCRTPFVPDPAALKKFSLPGKVEKLYHASGKVMVKDKPQPCPDCMGLGYRGRIGVFEVMILDDKARNYVATGEDDRLRAHLRRQRMLWLQEAALAKVVEGITDIKEVTRALSNKSSRRSSSRSKSRDKAGNQDKGKGRTDGPAAV
jgi:general secretion pathway protein E